VNAEGGSATARFPVFVFGLQRMILPLFHSKAWLVVCARDESGKRVLTLRELSEISGIGYKSLSVCLVKWGKWNYLGYQPYPDGRSYHF